MTISRIIPLGLSMCLLAVTLFAANWNGKLIDASCYSDKNDASACPATSSTSAFALATADGAVLRFDDAGNTKAAEAVRAAEPGSAIEAEVTGEVRGNTIQVESVKLKN
jgi:hypothetical protein